MYKVKAKRIDNGEWVEGYYFHNPWTKQHIIKSIKDARFQYDAIKPKTICRPTGLKDKKGVDIWENDIIKILQTDWPSKLESDKRTLEEYTDSLTKVYEVKYKAPEFIALLKGEYEHNIFCGTHGYIEKIGTKFDNPELLPTNNTNE